MINWNGHGMTKDRYFQLQDNEDLSLTKEEIVAGWHFCFDWDGLLIHESDPEYEACTCGYKPSLDEKPDLGIRNSDNNL